MMLTKERNTKYNKNTWVKRSKVKETSYALLCAAHNSSSHPKPTDTPHHPQLTLTRRQEMS